MKLFITGLLILVSVSAFSQESATQEKKKKVHGTFYATWGYQRDYYTNSTIHFHDSKSDNYDFKLYHAKAHDRLDFNSLKDYINTPLTVPQYVLYAGYFFGNKGDWGIEAGWDHLKYIVYDDQEMHLKGDIRGQHYDLDTVVTPSLVHFEHTNGNNYLTASIVKRSTFLRSPKGMHKFSALTKLGGGVLVPKTQSNILGHDNDGPFRPSGFVVTAAVALRYDMFRYFFIEHSVKGAFADYTNAKLYEYGRVQHHFFSAQLIFSFGWNIPMSKADIAPKSK
jgi:hypothetical protein